MRIKAVSYLWNLVYVSEIPAYSGSASTAQEPGHFEVRTSSSQVTRMHTFFRKKGDFFGMPLPSVTLTFEPMTFKCHQCHVDLVMSNCDKFIQIISMYSEDRRENAANVLNYLTMFGITVTLIFDLLTSNQLILCGKFGAIATSGL